MENLRNIIKEAQVITVLTGAGVSTESGISDFRSESGLWKQKEEAMKIVSRSFFSRKPKLFWQHYKELFDLEKMESYKPTTVHLFLKKLEDEGRDIRIFTQNIDGLHSKAGSKNVFEMHGSTCKAQCPKCKTEYDFPYIMEEVIPRCSKVNRKGTVCGFILKPDIVLFGDRVKFYEEAVNSINHSSLFLVLGSSLEVMPVNLLPQNTYTSTLQVKAIVNREPTHLDQYFDFVVHEELNHYFG